MKKIFNLMLSILTLVTMNPVIIFANEETQPLAMVSQMGTVDVNLSGIVLTTDYQPFEISVIKKSADEVQILDAHSGEIKEIIHFHEKSVARNYSQFFVLRDKYDGAFKITMEVVLDLWSSGSFRQINGVLGHKIFASGNSGTTLEDKSTQVSSQTGGYPTTGVNMSGSGVITQSSTFVGNFGISALVSAGFSYSSSGSYRKYTSMASSYRVY